MIKISVPSSSVWVHKKSGPLRIWYAGKIYDQRGIQQALIQSDFETLNKLLKAEYGGYALIIETEKFIFATTDKVESHRLCVYQNNNTIEISPDAQIWMNKDFADDFDEEQKQLYCMTGYCLGEKTLYKSVRRLLPGQYLFINKNTNQISYQRYYTYEPDFSGHNKEHYWQKKLNQILDNAIERTIQKANGHTIWLAMSAGYDSRLILAKLLQHDYKKIQTFSYGTPGNMEARVAKDLAASVNIPWRFIAPQEKSEKTDYWHGKGAKYLFFAGGLSSTPAMTEFYPLKYLQESEDVSSEDVFTNGQTGDFITGGHIPLLSNDQNLNITSYLFQKHFSLLHSLQNGFNEHQLKQYFLQWKDMFLQNKRKDQQTEKISQYLTFEWQERQCGYVINQQRAYDFLNLKWSLPLWDSELMDFYAKVPLSLQQNQKLYLSYLQDWNYRNLFDQLRLPYNPWPKYRFLVYTLAGLGHMVGGRKTKEHIYQQLYYYTDYNYLYKLYGHKCYRAFLQELRNPVSLQVLDYITRLKKRLHLDVTTELEKKFIPFSILYKTDSPG